MERAKSTLTDEDRENLVALLDGELDSATARQLETKLGLDANARAEAEQMKRTWDLLDYLPRAEPSPSFTHRTMDRLESLRPAELRAHRWRAVLAWAAVFLLASSAGIGALYTGARLFPPAQQPDNATQLIAQDLRLFTHLPTYLLVEDIQQIDELDLPSLFGDEVPESIAAPAPAASKHPVPEPGREEGERNFNNFKHVEQLASAKPAEYSLLKQRLEEFHRLPGERQASLRRLDHDLNRQEDTAVRAQRWRVLSRYASWVGALDETERERLQSADRDEWKQVVRELRDWEWLAHQPAQVKLGHDRDWAREHPDEIARLRLEEQRFRREWSDALKYTNDQPSALRSTDLPEEVQAFVSKSLLPNLTRIDRLAYDNAMKQGGKAYLETLIKLTENYAPASVSWSLLPRASELKRHFGPKSEDQDLHKKAVAAEGKWPEYGNALLAYSKRHPRITRERWFHTRLSDFDPTVQTFVNNKLKPVLSQEELSQLGKAEDREEWPTYHRTLMELARKHGMQVPGLSLPGSKDFWDRLLVSLPDEPDHVLVKFIAEQSGKELASVQPSLQDRQGRERLKEAYYRRNPDRLRTRLEEDYQFCQKKSSGR